MKKHEIRPYFGPAVAIFGIVLFISLLIVSVTTDTWVFAFIGFIVCPIIVTYGLDMDLDEEDKR